MREQNVRCRMFGEIGVYRRTVHRVTARRISAIRPINEPIFQIEFEINRFRQTIEQKFDVRAVRSRLTIRDVDLRTEAASFAGIIVLFLQLIDLSASWINSYSYTLFG